MQYRFTWWPAVGVAGFLLLSAPPPSMSQSRGMSSQGADSGYHSGSAASGHYGTSGSSETFRRDDARTMTEAETVPSRADAAPSDESLGRRIRETLQADRGLAPYADRIFIDVESGEVTLRGPVKTEKDKADIAAQTRRIAGVMEVHNQLQVAPNLSGSMSGRSEAVPEHETGSAMFQRQSGVAHSGPVFYQPIAMRQYGPSSQFDQNFSANEFLTQAERDLIERVAVNVAIDPATAWIGRDITISAEQGVVILQGPVSTEQARARLLHKVASIPGVVRVQDELRISGTAAADLSDRTARGARIGSEVRVAPSPPLDGAALAEGRYHAHSGGFPATQRRGAVAAEDEALTGSGQMHKEDRTGTTGPSGSRNTSPMDTGAVDGTGRVTKIYGDYAVTTNDRALVSQVRMALSGNPEFQATDTLHLKADNGTVHLFGRVSSEQEREAMEATVRSLSGVQEVINHLQVRATTIGTVR